ncbi:MAG: hypothetical protein COT67_00075, partial [Candidatus Tagabacteria bacterium CG09_land_8_20_14_0_10_41_14]
FLWNPREIFTPKDISTRAKVKSLSLRRELSLLAGIGLIKRKSKKRVQGWAVDNSFSLLQPLKALVLDTAPISRSELIRKISKTGRIKLIILGGVFIQSENSRIDILVVGNKVNKNTLERALKEIEAEVGKELTYALLAEKDFVYRLGIYDKFIRDILDYPHQIVVDKMGLSDIL